MSISTFASVIPPNTAQNLFRLCLDLAWNRRLIGREGQLHRHLVARDLNSLDQSKRNNIAAEAGIFYRLERCFDLFFSDRHEWRRTYAAIARKERMTRRAVV